MTSDFAVDTVLVHTDPIIEDLTIDNETLQTTPEHPFFTADKGFVAAGDLHVGEQIRKADGSYGAVKAIKLIAHLQQMYNLTVHIAHTFFVGVKQWLVHNVCYNEYDIVPYKTKVKGTNPPLEKHHGIMDVWADANIPNYERGDAPAVLLTHEDHVAATNVYVTREL